MTVDYRGTHIRICSLSLRPPTPPPPSPNQNHPGGGLHWTSKLPRILLGITSVMVQLNANGKRSLGSGIAFLVLAPIAVPARFYSKSLTKAKYAADDWWITLSLVAFSAFFGVELWGEIPNYLGSASHNSNTEQATGIISGGGGENIQSLMFDFATLQTYIKVRRVDEASLNANGDQSLYTLIAFYGLTVTTSRLSILCLYRRIFVFEGFQKVSLVVGVLCAAWWLVFTIVSLNPCRPVRKFWRPEISGDCFNFNHYILVMGILDLLLDATILVLPIRPVVNLHMSMTRKALVCAIFLVGGLWVHIPNGLVRKRWLTFKCHYYWDNTSSFDVCPPLSIQWVCLPRFLGNKARLAKRFTQSTSQEEHFGPISI